MNELEPKQGEVWMPWWELEEVKHNMWGDVTRRKTWLQMVIAFTGDAELYGYWMMKVITEWPQSCAHNLSKCGDKRAWIGHAAVALAIGCPEDIVREAWGYLTEEQQIQANEKATKAIELWRERNA